MFGCSVVPILMQVNNRRLSEVALPLLPHQGFSDVLPRMVAMVASTLKEMTEAQVLEHLPTVKVASPIHASVRTMLCLLCASPYTRVLWPLC